MLSLLQGMSGTGQTMLVLSLVSVLGLALGRIRVAGVSLGIGGILFAGIAIGHVAADQTIVLDRQILEFVREFGLMLFVYTIGIQVGPGFFAAFRRSGLLLNGLAITIIAVNTLIAVGIFLFAGLPLPVVLGLFAGAVTNIPSLAAAQQVLKEVGAGGDLIALATLGCAVAYPFGIAGVLLTMIGLRVVFRVDPVTEAARLEARANAGARALETLDLVVEARAAGRTIAALQRACGEIIVSRFQRDGELQVPRAGLELAVGDRVHVVGPPEALVRAEAMIGAQAPAPLTTKGTPLTVQRLVVTRSGVLGKTLGALGLIDRSDVVISRLNRAGIEFVASPGLKLQFGDSLVAIGRPDAMAQIGALVGNRSEALQHAHMIPIFLGLALGILLGSIPILIPGLPGALKLGLAGGPIVAAIVLARIGHIGPLVWFMPPGINLALREIGIILFFAVVGFQSGDGFIRTLVEGEGLAWMAWGVLITLIPMLAIGVFAMAVLRLDYFTTCGLLSGSTTNPPALAFANSLAPTSAASLAYATVYPMATCLRILVPQILVLSFWV